MMVTDIETTVSNELVTYTVMLSEPLCTNNSRTRCTPTQKQFIESLSGIAFHVANVFTVLLT